MKIILFVLGVLVAAVRVNCQIPPELAQAFGECDPEIEIPDEKLNKPLNMDNPQIKCFNACLMKKAGTMVDGKVALEKVIEFSMKHLLTDNRFTEKIIECTPIANEQTDECEVAAAMYNCILEKFGTIPALH